MRPRNSGRSIFNRRRIASSPAATPLRRFWRRLAAVGCRSYPANRGATCADFDPYRCNLAFRIVSNAARDAVDTHFAYVTEVCTIQPARQQAQTPASEAQDNSMAIDLLMFQKDALALDGDDALWTGRVLSATSVLRSVAQSRAMADVLSEIDSAQTDALADIRSKALLALIDKAVGVLRGPKPEVAPQRQTDKEPPDELPTTTKRQNAAVKVEQEVLDTMMKLVGEMIVAKNALPFLVKRAEDVHGNRRLSLEIKSEYEAINRIVEDMQASIMQMRMVPVSHVFQRYQRLVRDISRRLDKKVTLHMEGEDTKADKNIVEELADPLVHLIRNACDHGLETTPERVESGKSETGHITLSARQLEDQVVVAVRDDGRGINVDRVKQKAIENGLVTSDAAEKLDDKSAMQLILQPGFSTADQISDLSGRGVGMDVVNSMVKRAGGRLWIDSTMGTGSEISIALPISMAVSQVMMFEVGPTLYGISIENIVETVRIRAKEIHRFKATEQILLRGRLIPLCRARAVFGLEIEAAEPDDELSILVVRNGDQELGFVVDRVRSEADVKLETIDECLNSAGYFSGAALLGDGSIMLLINARELF